MVNSCHILRNGTENDDFYIELEEIFTNIYSYSSVKHKQFMVTVAYNAVHKNDLDFLVLSFSGSSSLALKFSIKSY